MTLDATISLRADTFTLDAGLRAQSGELVVLVGPNGAGKTTLLRAIAGLVRINAGRVAVGDEILDDAAATHVPPHGRDIALVPQADALMPHLDVLDNVAFGPRCRGVRRRAARADAMHWLEVVGLGALARRRPASLSGGEAKRASLARALAVRPKVLLMDEPFTGLDATTRRDMRRELKTYLATHDCARVLVTHDPIDALTLADRVVVLEEGRVVQDVVPGELRLRPRSRYVADLVGVNLFRGDITSTGLRTTDGIEIVAADSAPYGSGFAAIHPRSVALHLERPEGSPRNVWRGVVGELDDEGDRLRVRIDGPISIVAEVTPSATGDLGLVPGVTVYASVKATEVRLYGA